MQKHRFEIEVLIDPRRAAVEERLPMTVQEWDLWDLATAIDIGVVDLEESKITGHTAMGESS